MKRIQFTSTHRHREAFVEHHCEKVETEKVLTDEAISTLFSKER